MACPDLSKAINGLTENIQCFKFSQTIQSGIAVKEYTPFPLTGNMQMGSNDDLLMVPEMERNYPLWRLLVAERTQALKQGDLLKMTYQGKEMYLKVIGCKDNTRSGFSRYILQDRPPNSDVPSKIAGAA